MLLPPPIPFRGRRRRQGGVPVAPAALTLVMARLDYEPEMLRLKFDRAIDASGLVADQVSVNDPAGTGWSYIGFEFFDQPDPDTIVITLSQNGSATGTITRMSATGSTGLVAVGDGAAWAGVTDLALPFG